MGDTSPRAWKRLRVGAGPVEALVAWATADGAAASQQKMVIAVMPDGRRCVKAAQDLEAGTEFATLPRKFVITGQMARESLVGQAIASLEKGLVEKGLATEPLPAQLYLWMFMVGEKALGDASTFAAYINCLPSTFDDPMWFTTDELDLLVGTNLALAHKQERDRLQRLYDTIFPAIYEAHASNATLFPKEFFTFQNLCWARSVYVSRGFRADVGTKNPSKDESGCMLPYLDMLNHGYGTAITWVTYDDHIAFRTESRIAKGQELFNNYGPKGNEELLHGYGFVLENNPADSVAIKVGIATSDNSLSEVQRNLLQQTHKQLSGRSYDDQFLFAGSLSVWLLGVLRVCLATSERDLQILRERRPTDEPIAVEQGANGMLLNVGGFGSKGEVEWMPFISHENEVAVADNLVRLIQGRQERYKAIHMREFKDAVKRLDGSSNGRLAMVTALREGHMRVYEGSLKAAQTFRWAVLGRAFAASPPLGQIKGQPTNVYTVESLQQLVDCTPTAERPYWHIKRDVAAGERLLWIPDEATISVDDSRLGHVKAAIETLVQEGDGRMQLEILLLRELSTGAQGAFADFFNALPPKMEELMLEHEDTRVDPETSTSAEIEMAERVQDLHSLLVDVVPQLVVMKRRVFPLNMESWSKMLLASTIVQLFAVADKDVTCVPCLVPHFRHHPYAPFEARWERHLATNDPDEDEDVGVDDEHVEEQEHVGLGIYATSALPANTEIVLDRSHVLQSERISLADAAVLFGQ